MAGRPPAGSRCSRRARQAAAEQQQLQRVARILRSAVDVPVGALRLPVGAALEDHEARPAVRVLALRPVPDAWAGEVEQPGLGGELPLVLGGEPGADRGGVRCAPRRDRARSSPLAPRSRTARAAPGARPRRSRAGAAAAASTPRRTAPRRTPRLAAAEDGGQRARLDRREPLGHRVGPDDRSRHPHRLPCREARVAAARDHHLLPADERRDPKRGQLDLELADRAPRMLLRGWREPTASSRRPSSATRRRAYRPSTRPAASTRRSPAARRACAGRGASRAAAPCPARSSRPRRRRRSPRRACRRRSARRCAAPRRGRGSSGACGGACGAARTSAPAARPGRRCRRTTAPRRGGGRRPAPAAASTRLRARRQGARGRAPRGGRAAPPSSCRGRRRPRRGRATSSAIATSSATGSRRVPTSQGL